MTIKELYDSVAQLGFETSLEDDQRFILAANRAILQVNRIRPATSIYKLNHFPLVNKLEMDSFEPICKDDAALIYIADNVKAYYFECNGNGTLTIEKTTDSGATWTAINTVSFSSSDKGFKSYKGFIKDGSDFYSGTIRLKFTGDYIYYLQNIALYGNLVSGNVADIPPYSKYNEYNIASLVSDFQSFACPPIVDAKRAEGFVLDKDYFVEGVNTLLLPSSIKSTYEVRYNRIVNTIPLADADMETNIDLDNELCALLPNLVASYVWVDDEPSKAEYYLSLYREQAAVIAQETKHFTPFVYRNKNGW